MLTCLYLEENIDIRITFRDVNDLSDAKRTEKIRNLDNIEIFKWDCEEEKCGNVKREWCSVVLNKVWPCLTFALASYFLSAANFI